MANIVSPPPKQQIDSSDWSWQDWFNRVWLRATRYQSSLFLGSATTGTTVTIDDVTRYYRVTSTANAANTVVLPANPVEGQTVAIFTGANITTLTISPNTGQSVSSTFAATLTAHTSITYVYNSANTTWYRVE